MMARLLLCINTVHYQSDKNDDVKDVLPFPFHGIRGVCRRIVGWIALGVDGHVANIEYLLLYFKT